MSNYPVSGSFPVIAMKNFVFFPGIAHPIRVGRAKSILALERAQATEGQYVLLLSQKPATKNEENPALNELYLVGVLCKIERVKGTAKRGFNVLVTGLSRFKVSELREESGALFAQAEELKDNIDIDSQTQTALLTSLKKLSQELLELLPANTDQLSEFISGIDDLSFLSHLCAANLELEVVQKQELLESLSVKNRVLHLLELMHQQKENMEVQSEIREKLNKRMSKVQREAILREQLRAIQEELGDEAPVEKENFKKKIEDAGMSEEAKKVALEELKRFKTLGQHSPESPMIRSYIEFMCALPWKKSSTTEIDLKKARQILDADHYGLDVVKNRIIQHLAVVKLKKSLKGTILLFVGPPGVGKTSLGQSIAKALGRKFVRVSLGGIRDEAEIRGHRKTYIGSMPGRILQSIKRAGENDPVMLLDELDKVAHSFHGDPSAALLEVLDPEQNHTFTDHYLDVAFDLSKIFFIGTANSLDSIPAPLMDRLEVIELTGYTTAEKIHIAKKHLIPKQFEEHGIKEDQLLISDEALLRMITHYTREAGVRDLQRKIAALCRFSTEKILSNGSFQIGFKDLEEILGAEKFQHEVTEGIMPEGVVTGLAWTPQGGEILFVESSLMPGTGKLTLTGQMGEVMKESAQIALSLVRSHLSSLNPTFNHDSKDYHLHIPAGAIPKDGPSAGVTMFTSLASLVTGRRVDPKLAMSGEITLRGAVLPVGGVKEKVIAAHRAGVQKIILSKKNQKDIKEIPSEVKNQIQFVWVENVEQLLKEALSVEIKKLSTVPSTAALPKNASPCPPTA
jgi:ATP-dependent Lon protease